MALKLLLMKVTSGPQPGLEGEVESAMTKDGGTILKGKSNIKKHESKCYLKRRKNYKSSKMEMKNKFYVIYLLKHLKLLFYCS